MRRNGIFALVRWCAVLLGTGLTPAAIIYDSGSVTFAPTGTQFGRISRDGTASDWSGVKPFPGVTGAPTARNVELIMVNSGPFPFLQISLDDPAAMFFDAAYLTSFTPVNLAPNFGLDVNYLGDPGLSEPFGFPSFFQVTVAPGTNVLIPINEITPGGGAGQSFDLIVEGFFTTDFVDTPEPSSVVLAGFGTVFLGAIRLIRRRRGGLTS